MEYKPGQVFHSVNLGFVKVVAYCKQPTLIVENVFNGERTSGAVGCKILTGLEEPKNWTEGQEKLYTQELLNTIARLRDERDGLRDQKIERTNELIEAREKLLEYREKELKG